MDQESGFAAISEIICPASRRPVLSLAGACSSQPNLSLSERVLQVRESADGTIIRLVIQPDIRKAFPVRASDARNSFLRHCRNIDHVKLEEEDRGTVAIRLRDAGRADYFRTIDRKLHERLYRPLSAREAAGVLGVDKKAFRRLREDSGIMPCGRIAASRYGRAWSYVVFAVADVMKMQSMLPAVSRCE